MRTSLRTENTRGGAAPEDLGRPLGAIAEGAAARDAAPSFPEEAFRALAASGILGMTAPEPGEDRPVSFYAEEARRPMLPFRGAMNLGEHPFHEVG